MAAASCVSLLAKRIIKPFSPTPLSKRTHKLSYLDQISKGEFVPVSFFYPNQNPLRPNTQSKISQHLQESLSKTLTSYYPFAGTLIGNTHLDCNDRGVDFQEVRFNCPMSDIVNLPQPEFENSLFPKNLPWSYLDKESLVSVQLNHFDCGGVAVSVCLSHKVADGTTAVKFIKDWASVSRDSSSSPQAQFDGASLFPPMDDPAKVDILNPQRDNYTTKKYHFSATNIHSLKNRIISSASDHHGSEIRQFSSVDAVSSLLYRTAASNNSQKPSILTQMVNLRSITSSIIPQDYVGNASTFFYVSAANEEEMELHRLVSEIKKAKKEVYDTFKNVTRDDLAPMLLKTAGKLFEIIQGQEFDRYSVTSIYKMPIRDIDFGWGKPTKMVIPTFPLNFGFILTDNLSGDGLEALVNMEKTNVSAFENKQELLEFASCLC